MMFRFAQIFLMILVLLSLTSCKTGKPASSQSTASVKYTVALVMKTLTNPFFMTMEKGAHRAEIELGITLLVKAGAKETSIEQQISIVEQLITEKVDAIVIAPAGSAELVPILKKAQDSGIKIVNIDNRLDPEACLHHGLSEVPFISVDNIDAAFQAVQYICKDVQTASQAAILEGIPGAVNAEDRKTGALKAFKENPYIKVVASASANWKVDEAYELTGKMFREHPRIKLLFCANDMMAMGAMQYLQDKGIKGVKVAGFDNLDEIKPFLKDGLLSVTIDQQADEQGYKGVDYAVKLLKGETVQSQTMIPVKLVTP